MRLTDRQLEDVVKWCARDVASLTEEEITALVDEVRERRAADLTDDERATLRALRLMLACGDAVNVAKSLALLNRLIGG